jgi:hypothetical protein
VGEANILKGIRSMSVERRPESIRLLRQLQICQTPASIRSLASAIDCPVISTRTRLAKLERAGAVQASRRSVNTDHAKSAVCLHYSITQYGQDSLSWRQDSPAGKRFSRPVNSVFELGQALL